MVAVEKTKIYSCGLYYLIASGVLTAFLVFMFWKQIACFHELYESDTWPSYQITILSLEHFQKCSLEVQVSFSVLFSNSRYL